MGQAVVCAHRSKGQRSERGDVTVVQVCESEQNNRAIRFILKEMTCRLGSEEN